ncbi:Uncharacterised protein [Legionella sainthelensi]|nr:Uncharacterised protein [Legionella sainthelensi]
MLIKNYQISACSARIYRQYFVQTRCAPLNKEAERVDFIA